MTREELNALSKRVLDASFAVHSALGPGLLENIYSACLTLELKKMGINVETEVPVPVIYNGQKVADIGYRLDLLVAGALIVEVKAVEGLHPLHSAQLLSYLKLSQRRLGLLINFNTVHLREGIRRLANGF